MLVLSRKPGQSILIKTPHGTVFIHTLREDRIGIEAPRNFRVTREELDERPRRVIQPRPRSA
jgi:carbon storage regulator CsrA